MSNLNIKFNNKSYSIDSASLAPAQTALQSHLATVMNGTGATINLGGVDYNIDSTKLATAKNDFVSHLGKISGNGSKVVIGGVEYGIGGTKVENALSGLHEFFGTIGEELKGLVAGLYQPGAIALMQEQGEEAIADMLITSWDDMLASGAINVTDGVVSIGAVIPTLPEKNEYGFYYGVKYTDLERGFELLFNSDGSVAVYLGNELIESAPPGVAIYGNKTIDMSAMELGVGVISDDGKSIIFADANMAFSLLIPTEINEYGFYYGVPYKAQLDDYVAGLVFHEDGSFDVYQGDNKESLPAGSAVYSNGSIDLSAVGLGVGIITANGIALNIAAMGATFALGEPTQLAGDLIFPTDGSITEFIFSTQPLTSVVIPDSVTTLGYGAFSNCSSLASIVIPDSVTTIGAGAFYHCISLISVIIGNNVTTIVDSAFDYCTSLTSVVIPDSVTTIGYCAFYKCFSLTSVVIGDSVITIGEHAFDRCSSLVNITFNGTIEQWNAISKGTDWNEEVPATEVICSDGTVAL